MSSDPTHRVDDPALAMERLRGAMQQIVTVSKPEILRREREAKEERKKKRGG
jgi:hypothetical protein